ncbi:MAG: hypothetical protein OXE53_19820 [Deltaproteobacteria bacterium]|nr:hypothetical protein [Deltaproteobacteria bacterium]
MSAGIELNEAVLAGPWPGSEDSLDISIDISKLWMILEVNTLLAWTLAAPSST